MFFLAETPTRHINTLRGHNVEFLNVKPCGIYSNHWAFKGCYYLLFYVSLKRVCR
jgi:hypothetical protein